ncbi:MAG: sigma-54 dependent transcriptional regulator [Gammaproteobacteria bacterium]|jgi:DNA-binding NtrC family response regulator
MPNLLVIEDEDVIRNAVKRLLERHGYDVATAESVEKAEFNFNLSDFNLILSDIRLPGAAGTEVMARAPGVPVLIMTAYASVRSAVEAMQLGAVDYIAKPFDHDELLMLVERTLKQYRCQRTNKALKSDVQREYPVAGMVGSCDAMQAVCSRIEKVAPTDTTVLILGESGTGKELVARAVHEKSKRSDAPFVTVNCAAIPETLIESELFGYEKGAFTGADSARVGLIESANGGTLFLDEIGELPQAAQARLLRVLQDGEIRRLGSDHIKRADIRLIAATNRDLKQAVQDGSFRSDLYFRLRVFELQLPPLRERGQDIKELTYFLLNKICKQLNRTVLKISEDAVNAIHFYHWPGNVRELENAIERAVILCDGDTISTDLLAIDHDQVMPLSQTRNEHDPSLENYFREFVLSHQETMTETELAKQLGISRKTLWERRQRFGLPKPQKKT